MLRVGVILMLAIMMSTGGSGYGMDSGSGQFSSVMNLVKNNIPKIQGICKYSKGTVAQVKNLANGLSIKPSCQSRWGKLANIIQVMMNCNAPNGSMASALTNKASLGLLGLLPVIGQKGNSNNNAMGLISTLGQFTQGSKQQPLGGLGAMATGLLSSGGPQPNSGSKQPLGGLGAMATSLISSQFLQPQADSKHQKQPSGSSQGDMSGMLATLSKHVNLFQSDQSPKAKKQVLSSLENVVSNCKQGQFKGCCN